MNENHSQEEIDIAFEMFVKGAQKVVSDWRGEQFPNLGDKTLSVNEGRKYWKVVARDGLNGGCNALWDCLCPMTE